MFQGCPIYEYCPVFKGLLVARKGALFESLTIEPGLCLLLDIFCMFILGLECLACRFSCWFEFRCLFWGHLMFFQSSIFSWRKNVFFGGFPFQASLILRCWIISFYQISAAVLMLFGLWHHWVCVGNVKIPNPRSLLALCSQLNRTVILLQN